MSEFFKYIIFITNFLNLSKIIQYL